MLSQSNPLLLSVCISMTIWAMDPEDPDLRYEPYSTIKRFSSQREGDQKRKEELVLSTLRQKMKTNSFKDLEEEFKKEVGKDLWDVLLLQEDQTLFVDFLAKKEEETKEALGQIAFRAATYGNAKAFGIIHEKGAIITKKDSEGNEIMVDEEGNTILMKAVIDNSLTTATKENVTIVEQILEKTPQLINCTNKNKENALLMAVRKRNNENYDAIDQIITSLLQYGEELHVQEDSNEERAFKNYLAQPYLDNMIIEEEGYTNHMKNLPIDLRQKITGMVAEHDYANHQSVKRIVEQDENEN